MSKTVAIPPIDACFLEAEVVIEPKTLWQSINPLQASYLEKLLPRREDLKRFSPQELRSWVSKNADELNKILKGEGFDIQLKPFDPEEFGVVSILDVLVEWLATGEKCEINRDGKHYPAVSMDSTGVVDGKYETFVEAHRVENHAHPVVRLNTKSGDIVCMTIAESLQSRTWGELECLELAERINDIRDVSQRIRKEPVSKLIFPMIDLNQEEDISWLKGMWTEDCDRYGWVVSQALQQTKLKMNEKGARVKSAVAIGVTRSTSLPPPPRVIVIDRPFYFWIERPGLTQPIMYAYLDEKDWKNPGDLGNM